MKPQARQAPPDGGFTLIEMLIVVGILSLLVALALPNYSSHLRRAKRTEAQAAMLRAAQWMERAASANGRYPETNSIPAALLLVPGQRYTLQIESPDPTQAGVASYRITATRMPNSDQANDECGDLVLDQSNRRSTIRQAPNADAGTCWGR